MTIELNALNLSMRFEMNRTEDNTRHVRFNYLVNPLDCIYIPFDLIATYESGNIVGSTDLTLRNGLTFTVVGTPDEAHMKIYPVLLSSV